MAEIDFFHYEPSDHWLHKTDTAAKFLSSLVISIAAFRSPPLVILFLFLFFAIIFRKIFSLKKLSNFKGFYLFLIIIIVLRTFGNDSPWQQGLKEGAFYSWKLFFLLFQSQILLCSTDPAELHGALYRILKKIPLIPAGTISIMASMTLTFIPLIFDQYLEIKAAADSRLGLSGYNPLRRILVISRPLLESTLSRGEEIARAMESRCFQEDPSLREIPWTKREFGIFFFALLFASVIVLLNL